jgi:hypothetical protein
MDFVKKGLVTIASAAALGIGLAGGAQAQTFDISGTESWDSLGDFDNTVLTLDIAQGLGLDSGSAVELFGVEWDLTIGTFGISWLSEADIKITDTVGNTLFDLDPGSGFGGTETFMGSETLATSAFLFDGLVNVEFYESFVDNSDGVDAVYLATSTLTFDAKGVPEPATILGLALFGGALCATKRKKKDSPKFND